MMRLSTGLVSTLESTNGSRCNVCLGPTEPLYNLSLVALSEAVKTFRNISTTYRLGCPAELYNPERYRIVALVLSSF
jgi:hypothetical protein